MGQGSDAGIMATDGGTFFSENPAGVQETVEEEGTAGPIDQDDLRLDSGAEKAALRAWFEPLIEPVILAQLDAEGALTVDSVTTILAEDFVEMGVAKFRARGLVQRIAQVWGRQGQQDMRDSQLSQISAAEERTAQVQEQLVAAQLQMQVFLQQQEQDRERERVRARHC